MAYGDFVVMNDLNFRLAPEELRFICDDSQVKVLFVDETFLPVAQQLRDSVASIDTLVWVGPGAAPKARGLGPEP